MKVPSVARVLLEKYLVQTAVEAYKAGKADHLDNTYDEKAFEKALRETMRKKLKEDI